MYKHFNINFIISLFLIVTSSSLFGQVGINTATPTKTLDINGELTVSTTERKSSVTDYNKVIVTNSSGDVAYWDKNKIVAEFEKPVVENKIMYFSSAPSGNIHVPCGKYLFRFNTSAKPEMKLLNNESNLNIFYSRVRMVEKNKKSLYGNYSVNLSFNNWSRIDQSVGTEINEYAVNTKDEYFITHPTEVSYYRVTFLARTMTQPNATATNSYTMICEKY